MIEVEIKVKLEDPGLARSGLERAGCVFIGTQVHNDTYYNARDRDFAETDEALRIRRSNKTSVITYKGPKIHDLSKSRREIEVEIGDPEAAAEILTALGFIEVLTVIKTRDIYCLDRFTISMDEVRGLGNYLEIETAAENAGEVAALVEEMHRILPDMGLKDACTTTKSYLELLLEKKADP